MIKNINFLGVPTRDKLNLFVPIGISLIALGFLDVILNTYFKINLTTFLPGWLNYFTPLFFGFIGFHYIRIEFTGVKILDNLNKNINSNWFNAVLTLLILFIMIQNIPPLLNWLFFDADFIGIQKKIVHVTEHVGFSLTSGLKDLYMDCIQMLKFGE